MKNKLWVFVAAALLVYGVFTMMSGGVEQRVVNLFSKHQATLEQQMETWETEGTLGWTENWKAVNHWSGEHEMVEYLVATAGDTYHGFYYSPEDVPLAFQNTDVPLVPAETEEGWIWTAEGDNRGRTYRLAERWFYFEAKF